MYNIKADLHTHSVFSLHAFSSIKENINEAIRKNIEYLAITDHYFHYNDDILRKNEDNRLQYLEHHLRPAYNNINIIGGVELNLSQSISPEIKKLKWKPIGIHSWFINRETTTLKEAKNYFFLIVFVMAKRTPLLI